MSEGVGDGGPESGNGAPSPGWTAEEGIPRRQLAALFGYSLVIWSLGNGILPLLPLMAENLGSGRLGAGLYLSVSYGAIALGSLSAGFLADLTARRRRLMLLVGAAGPVFVIATTFVTTILQLLVLTAIVWWLGGMALALSNIMAGLSAGPRERGKVLGGMALAAPAGSILGGFGVGLIADAVGLSVLWTVLGALWFACPLVGLAVREVEPPPAHRRSGSSGSGMLTAGFVLLLACGLLASVGTFIGALGRSLAMGDRGFSNVDITSTVAVSGLATLPFTVTLGVLSDRLGRVRFLALCYGAGILGLLVYSSATSLVNFWTASALVAFVSYVATGVGAALVVDLVDRRVLGRAMASFSTMGWTGGILGFAAGGYAFQEYGDASTFLFGAGIVTAAAALLVPVALAVRRRPERRANTTGTPAEPRKA